MPSLNNLYHAFDWFSAHDPTTNTKVFAYFTSFIGILCCIIALVKVTLRVPNPWHASPSIVALLLFHTFGNLEFDTLVSRSQKSWISPPDLLSPFHWPVKYSGLAAYALIFILFEEALLFFHPKFRSKQLNPRGYIDSTTFLLKVFLVTSSIGTNAALPAVQPELDDLDDTAAERPASIIKTLAVAFGLAGYIIGSTAVLSSTLPDVISLLNLIKTAIQSPQVSEPTLVAKTVDEGHTTVKQETDDFIPLTEEEVKRESMVMNEDVKVEIPPSTEEVTKVVEETREVSNEPVMESIVIVKEESVDEEILYPQENVVEEEQPVVEEEPEVKKEEEQEQESIPQPPVVQPPPIEEVFEYPQPVEEPEPQVIPVAPVEQPIEEWVEVQQPVEEEEVQQPVEEVTEVQQPIEQEAQVVEQQPLVEEPQEIQQPTKVEEAGEDVQSQKAVERENTFQRNQRQRQRQPLEENEMTEFGRAPESKARSKSPKSRRNSGSPARNNSGSPVRSPTRKIRSVDSGIVAMWSGVSSFDFRTDNFLRADTACDLLKAENILSFVELGKYLLNQVPRGNRAETTSASTVVFRLEQIAKDAKDPSAPIFVNKGNVNYFRSCLWLGQAFLTVFPQNDIELHVIHELPIEAIIKASGYSPDGFKTVGMLPEPGEIWRNYLQRMEVASASVTDDQRKSSIDLDEQLTLPPGQLAKGAEGKKIKEVHGWIERYLGGHEELLDREVPRAKGWESGVSLDINRILYRHLQNMMLLPPYNSEIQESLRAFKEKKAKAAAAAAETAAMSSGTESKGPTPSNTMTGRPRTDSRGSLSRAITSGSESQSGRNTMTSRQRTDSRGATASGSESQTGRASPSNNNNTGSPSNKKRPKHRSRGSNTSSAPLGQAMHLNRQTDTS